MAKSIDIPAFDMKPAMTVFAALLFAVVSCGKREPGRDPGDATKGAISSGRDMKDEKPAEVRRQVAEHDDKYSYRVTSERGLAQDGTKVEAASLRKYGARGRLWRAPVFSPAA